MKKIDFVPTKKIERVTKLLTTGAKVGGNYLKYYGGKIVNPELTKDQLHEDNATDIYDGLKELKGSALKVAQMLSMERNLLPKSYVDRFSLSQFSVPPLSAPLVRKTFFREFGQYPEQMFDEFAPDSVNAASIGQVHRARKGEKNFAVKIQYPGVKDSIRTDLAIVKPIAVQMFQLQGISDEYFQEVEDKLREETNYQLELQQGEEVRKACASVEGVKFPAYYEEFSCEKVLTMDWMEGVHLAEFTKDEADQEKRDLLGQRLWNFYMYQMHGLRKFHADPHPGNFLVDGDVNLIAIDFGCMKEIPESFYVPYFDVSTQQSLGDLEYFTGRLEDLEILKPTDTAKEREFFVSLFHEILSLFAEPLHREEFDFSDREFSARIGELSERLASDRELRKMNGNRGSRHFIYMNRTFFGLYNLMFDLGAKVQIQDYKRWI